MRNSTALPVGGSFAAPVGVQPTPEPGPAPPVLEVAPAPVVSPGTGAASDAVEGAVTTGSQPSKPGDSVGTTMLRLMRQVGLAGTALDFSRLVAAGPFNHRNGTTKLWLYSMAPMIGPGPNTRVVPYERGAWKAAYRASNSISPIMAVMSTMVAVPSLIDAVQQGGPEGVVTTRTGRTGLLTATGTGLTFAVIGAAMLEGRSGGKLSMVKSMVDSPLRGNLRLRMLGTALTPLVFLNESGVFDFLDPRNKLSPADSISTGLANLPNTVAHIMIPFL